MILTAFDNLVTGDISRGGFMIRVISPPSGRTTIAEHFSPPG